MAVMPALRILVPEGSSLSAREAVTALGRRGHVIDILDPDPLCICRFSKYVRRVHRSPTLSASPIEYVQFLLAHIASHTYDLVFPVHEHAFVLSAFAEEIRRHCAVAVAPLPAFERLQSKVRFFELATELGLPHPPTQRVESVSAFPPCRMPPYYVKTAYGTAGDGTWRVVAEADRAHVLAALQERELAGNLGSYLVQDLLPGTLEVVQSVFDHGELVAVHGYRQHIPGVGGSASGRIGVNRPAVIADLQRLGRAMQWHGALMLDYMFDDQSGGYWFIDPNPRLGETMNALLSGVDLPQALVEVTQGQRTEECRHSDQGVRSHILLSASLATAIKEPTRRAILSQLLSAWRHLGKFAESREEVALASEDYLSLVPTLTVAAQLLLRPSRAQTIATHAIANYALSGRAVGIVRDSWQKRQRDAR